MNVQLPETHSAYIPDQTPELKIIRRPAVLEVFGGGNTWLHERIKKGLMTPPVSLGSRSVGWPHHEPQAILAAMIAGKSDDHIKALVGHLVDQRKNAA